MKNFPSRFTASLITGTCLLSTFAPAVHAAKESKKAPIFRNEADNSDAAFKVSENTSIPTIRDKKIIIDIKSRKDTFYAGDEVSLDVKMKNNGASRPLFSISDWEALYDVEVVGPQKTKLTKLPPASLRQSGSIRIQNFGNSRVVSGSISVSSLFDMSHVGPYRIKVSKRFHLQGTQKPVVISSNVLTIKVTSDTPLSDGISFK